MAGGYHVVLEGILHRAKYSPMIEDLRRNHPGETHLFYLVTSFEETVRRHGTRPQVTEFTTEQMRDWYQPFDVLGVDGEHVVAEDSTEQDSVLHIAATAGLSLDERDDDPAPQRLR